MTNSSQAAAVQVTDPVAEATRLEGNGAAPSTNTVGNTGYPGKEGGRRSCNGDDYRDGGCCTGGEVAMATTIVMAAGATAAEPGGGYSGESSWLHEQSVLFEA